MLSGNLQRVVETRSTIASSPNFSQLERTGVIPPHSGVGSAAKTVEGAARITNTFSSAAMWHSAMPISEVFWMRTLKRPTSWAMVSLVYLRC